MDSDSEIKASIRVHNLNPLPGWNTTSGQCLTEREDKQPHSQLTEPDTLSQVYIHTDSRATECGGAATRNVGGSAGFPLACVCIKTV